MSFHAVPLCCLAVVVVSVVLPIAIRTLWLRVSCVAAVLLTAAVATFQLWINAVLVVSHFQSGIKPGTEASWGQFHIQTIICEMLPIFVVSIVGLSVLVFVPIREQRTPA